MADAEAVNGVAAGSIEAINGVAKASIQAINGAGLPASGASLWCIVGEDGAVATAAGSDLNAWTGYVSALMGPATQDYNTVAYGEDGSGGPMWIAVNSNNNRDIRWNADPTAGIDSWGNKNPTSSMYGATWSDGVWLAVGGNGEVWRSTSGSGSWSEIDLSGVTGWSGSDAIREVVGDGAGSFMFAQGMNVFLSTDAGETWARVVDLAGVSYINATGYTGCSMSYTASRWCVLLRKSGQSRAYHAAASDTSTWTASTAGGSTATGQLIVSTSGNVRMAAANGVVIIASENDISRSTDGGQDWTKYNASHPADGALPRGSVRDIATDGSGTWICVHDTGRVSISTNEGLAWTEQTGNNASPGDRQRLSFPFNGTNIENLESIAANVLLPL